MKTGVIPRGKALLLLFPLIVAAGCREADPCTKPLALVANRSASGESILCKTADGRIAQWTAYKDRKPWQVCRYKDGRPHGPFEALHPTGGRWIEGAYENGALAGHWRQWDKTGALVAEADYREGRLVEGAPVGMAATCQNMKP
jgi:hypothetical protein